jgi:hypothetical protein
MTIVADPALRVVAAEVYPPPPSVTEPVGVGFPPPPATMTPTLRLCVVLMIEEDGVTVTVGVINPLNGKVRSHAPRPCVITLRSLVDGTTMMS